MTKKRNPADNPIPVRIFALAAHHRLILTGYAKLITVDSGCGLKLLTSPTGLPVARLHTDLRANEVSLVLR